VTDIPHILNAIDAGDPQAAAELLPLVYQELCKLAAARLAGEKPGQTLQAAALVHEAYLRLVGQHQGLKWDGRGHFFASAAEAMRRILIENARSKQGPRRGGKPLPRPCPRIRSRMSSCMVFSDLHPSQKNGATF